MSDRGCNIQRAGSKPIGCMQPMAAELAAHLGYDTAQLRSKSWDECVAPGASMTVHWV